MTRKIFKSTLGIAIITLIFSISIITGVLYKYFDNTQQSQLRSELYLAARATEKLGEEYLKELNYHRFRITWIDKDGDVIYDSHVGTQSMQNHSDRKEIRDAFAQGEGSSTRYSDTLTEETIYEAIRLEDGTVLRISISSATVLALILRMAQPISALLLLVIILSVCLTHYMAKKIVEPLNKLNLENPMENDTYEEIAPLLHRIHSQQFEIKCQMSLLEHQQEEFKQITENMKEALVLLDSKDKIISLNSAAKELFYINGEYEEENLFAIDRKQEMRIAIEEVKKNGKSSFIEKRNGKDYHFQLSRIDSEEGIQGVVILAFDISDKLNAERNRREFTANVSHELKTPLQSIIGSAELLENGIVKEEDIPRFINNIRKEASRLVSLINDIIHLSRVDEKAEMPREEVSLYAMAEEIKEVLLESAYKKNVTIEVSGNSGNVKGVRSLMYEMIYNLCDNAIKYSKDAGYIKIAIEEKGDELLLSVKDNGIGILKEHHEKIFERFYRVDKSHSKQSGGTGLGLSIVKHAVQYHNGKIMIESEPGEGTTFLIILNKSLNG
ncbi:MAG: GHKL domain-containing protein [Lachnospiraceae bacterium]|nr:GHKL domain-containing protein [Lachnospiraceae bacterium]